MYLVCIFTNKEQLFCILTNKSKYICYIATLYTDVRKTINIFSWTSFVQISRLGTLGTALIVLQHPILPRESCQFPQPATDPVKQLRSITPQQKVLFTAIIQKHSYQPTDDKQNDTICTPDIMFGLVQFDWWCAGFWDFQIIYHIHIIPRCPEVD